MTARPPSGSAMNHRLWHRDRQPLAQLPEHPGLRFQRQRSRRTPWSPDDPAHPAVVVDEGHVVLAGIIRRGSTRTGLSPRTAALARAASAFGERVTAPP